MNKNLLPLVLTVSCVSACGPQQLRLPDGTNAVRIGCLDPAQCKDAAEKFCKGPYRLVDQHFANPVIQRNSTREELVYDRATQTYIRVQVPVTDVDKGRIGQATVQCVSAVPEPSVNTENEKGLR